MCIKGLPFTKDKSSAIYTLWPSLGVGGNKVILGIVLYCSGRLMIALSIMIGICGTYMTSDQLILSMAIGKFIICFFSRLILVLVFMYILQVFGVLFLLPLI